MAKQLQLPETDLAIKPPVDLPTPLGNWVLVRKEKKHSGLVLPDTAADAFNFIVVSVGPEVEHIEPGMRLELQPRSALATAVMLDDNHGLIRSDAIVGVYS